MACHSEMCNGSQRCFDNHKDILTAPDLFMIILARYDQYGQHLKNNHTVPIDMEVTLPTSRRRSVNKYTLQSLIQHRGNTTVGGHFTAVCRRADDSFFVIDDARSYAWNRKVTEQNAYILFYTKQTSAYLDTPQDSNDNETRGQDNVEASKEPPQETTMKPPNEPVYVSPICQNIKHTKTHTKH